MDDMIRDSIEHKIDYPSLPLVFRQSNLRRRMLRPGDCDMMEMVGNCEKLRDDFIT